MEAGVISSSVIHYTALLVLPVLLAPLVDGRPLLLIPSHEPVDARKSVVYH